MRTLTIIYLATSPKMTKEAYEMQKFLIENGVPCMLCGFSNAGPAPHDAVLDMARNQPIINASILPATDPRKTYVQGLRETMENIKRIKDFVVSR